MKPVVHYYERTGALRSGHLVRRIERGSRKGAAVVRHLDGTEVIPNHIRNIEGDSETLF